jgi:catechol 2,3-dioxygenase-like lactoylglutathione lyase family enzyme
MAVERLGHYSIRTFDLEASRRFYTEVLGFREGYRPPFPFPGVWLYLSDDEREYGTVHIIGIDPKDPKGLIDYLGDKSADELDGTGTVDHIGFVASGLSEMRRKLRANAIDYRERTVPLLALHQLFLTDPSGVTIELNYPAAEAHAAAG